MAASGDADIESTKNMESASNDVNNEEHYTQEQEDQRCSDSQGLSNDDRESDEEDSAGNFSSVLHTEGSESHKGNKTKCAKHNIQKKCKTKTRQHLKPVKFPPAWSKA